MKFKVAEIRSPINFRSSVMNPQLVRTNSTFLLGFRPKTESSPEVGRSKPGIMRSRVLLPAPLGPTTPTTVPGLTSQLLMLSSKVPRVAVSWRA